MRIDLKKFLFIGPEVIKDTFFESAQKVGVIDFIEKNKKGSSISEDTAAIIEAIKVTRRYPPLEPLEGVEPKKAQRMAKEINDLWQEHQTVQGQLNDLIKLRNEIAPFGNFTLEKVHQIEKEGGQVVQFFSGRHGLPREELPSQGLVKIAQSDELDYYISVQKERITHPKLAEIQMNRSLSDVNDEVEKLQERLETVDHKLRDLQNYHDPLHDLLLAQINKDNLVAAKGKTVSGFDSKVFMATGYVPVDDERALSDLCKSSQVFFEEVQIEEGDKVPTCLKNEGYARIGEDLVHVYDTPSHADQDPSFWVLAFFTLFFSIIVGDAGYGLVFLAGALFCWYKYPGLTGMKKRILKLFTLLSIGCVIWGILANNYFGIQLPPDHALRKVSFVNWMVEKKAAYHMQAKDGVFDSWVAKFPALKEATTPQEFIKKAVSEKDGASSYGVLNRFTDQILLELALIIGCLHICLSMGRYALRTWSMTGWIIFIIGAYLFIPAHLNYTSVAQYIFGISKPTALSVGKDMMIIGLIGACLFSLIQYRVKGLLEVAVLIQITSDILSYLRIYALGLAGGIMAATINQMTLGLPLAVGIIALFFAHFFNMLLGVMGGVIHGLRLNFLEWYHYSFEGGGRQFKPLRIQKKDE